MLGISVKDVIQIKKMPGIVVEAKKKSKCGSEETCVFLCFVMSYILCALDQIRGIVEYEKKKKKKRGKRLCTVLAAGISFWEGLVIVF